MRRILMVCDDYPPNPGGIAAHVEELCRALSRRGHKLDLCVGHHEDHSGAQVRPPLAGMTILRNRSHSWSVAGRVVNSADTARTIRRALSERPYDLVHWHSFYWEAIAVRLGAPGVPRVFTNHSSGYLKAAEIPVVNKTLVPGFLSFADRIITPSTELQERTVAVGYPAERVTMIPNGVDCELFSPAKPDERLRASVGLPSGAPVLVVPRRLVHKNGVDVLIRAMSIADGATKTAHAMLIGDGPERGALQALAVKGGIADRVHFLGTVERGLMPAHLRLADIGVLPSRMEAISLAGLEMMSVGLPLVGSDVGGIPQFVDDPSTGRLFPKEDAQALARTLRELLEIADTERRAIGARAREHVLHNYSWNLCAERVEQVYDELVPR